MMSYIEWGYATVAAGILSSILSAGALAWTWRERRRQAPETTLQVHTSDGRSLSISGKSDADVIAKLTKALRG